MKKHPKSREYLSGFLSFTLLFIAASGVFFAGANAVRASYESAYSHIDTAPRPVIVLDPGHGGEDGGASGADGTTEKELNLTVAKAVAELLRAAGYDVRLTRTEDRLLYDLYGDLADYTGKKKVYDLKNRLRFTKEAGAALLVSIHMNTFPDGRYSGLQVYYSQNGEESRTVAGVIQNYTKTYLQPENDRQTKRAKDNIYLLSHGDIPAVLVECGFLSNEAELHNLTDPAYQKKLAITIASAIGESLAGIHP